MKKILITLLALLTALSISVSATAFAETDKQVVPDTTKMIQWADYTAWEEEGLAVYAGQWKGGGFSMFFDVSNGQEFNVKFKVPVYQNDSQENVTENGLVFTKYIVDVIVESFDNQGKAVLRLWGDSGKSVDAVNVAGKITSDDLHDKSSTDKPNEVAEDIWVKGVMRENSMFDISFNTTDFFKSTWGNTNQVGSLLTVSGSVPNGQEVKNTLNETFNPEGNECKTVQVYFRLSAQCTYAECPITGCPSHDLNTISKLIITEVNGQSLANNSGIVIDNVAPFVAPVQVKENKEINLNKEYAIDIKLSPRDSCKSDIFCDYASDLLAYDQLMFTAKVVTPSGKEKVFDDINKIVFDEVGINKVTVTAVDLVGNSYTTPETEIDVVRGFLMTIEGVPTEGQTGTLITLPKGTATDKHAKECPVTLTVTDPYGQTITLDENNAFTPTIQGVYTATYVSQSEDGTGSDTQSFKIRVLKAEKKGCNSNLESGLILCALTLISSLVIVKKAKSR